MKYLTGYVKKSGHVVLEKADVRGIEAMMAVCGDFKDPSGVQEYTPVSGALKGKLATWFSHLFLNGIKEYGEDYLQAAVMGGVVSPASESPVIGPGCDFGSGCAGVLACGVNAYVWVSEGSGMCVLRTADVLGRRKLVKSLSSETGGEDILGVMPGGAVIICPEEWADKVVSRGEALIKGAGLIADDESLDRSLGGMVSEEMEGCMAALIACE